MLEEAHSGYHGSPAGLNYDGETWPNSSSDSAWIQTFTGKKFYPFNPKPQDIDIRDIAHALSNICRFTGHTKRFYSVAEHSRNVAKLVPAHMKLQALLHDASEAYLCDIARP